MRVLKGKNMYLSVFFLSIALQFLMMLLRTTLGIETSTIMGFFLYFSLCILSLRKISGHSVLGIYLSVILGLLIIQLPIRIISFNSTSVTFIEFVYQLLAIPFAWFIFVYNNITIRLIVIIFFTPIIIISGVYTNKFWRHKLDYGSFNSDVYYRASSQIEGTDIHGEKISLESFKGKIVVLDFWNTRCAPCFKKFPVLQRLSEKYNNDSNIVIIAVNHPLKSDTTNQAFNMLNSRKYSFKTIVLLNEKMIESIRVKYFPTTIILNKSGDIIFNGDILDSEVRIKKELALTSIANVDN